MEQNRLDYLKRAIKRTYKRYIGERTDGKATLIEVLKFFNVEIDEERIDDYMVNSIDYTIPSISVIDKKTNTTYTAKYTHEANLLNYSGSTDFINVIVNNSNYRLESLYYIGSQYLIISQMTFTDGDYELIFEREMPSNIGFSSRTEAKFVVRYIKNVEMQNQHGKQKLLSKIYSIKDNNGSFEQEYTYSPQYLIDYNDSQDKYCYINNGNVIYGINEYEVKDLVHYLNGICFKSVNLNVSRYLPYHIKSDEPIFKTNNAKSIIVFKGGTDHGIHHEFTISKTENTKCRPDYDLYLDYKGISWEYFKDEKGELQHKKIIVSSKHSRYPKIDSGNITSREIRNIVAVLETEFENNTFIQVVINELRTFANKMDIQKEIVQEELEPLSPKQFINKSFEEIYNLIMENKDEYFKLIAEQFDDATHIDISKEKSKVKVLKQNSQSSIN